MVTEEAVNQVVEFQQVSCEAESLHVDMLLEMPKNMFFSNHVFYAKRKVFFIEKKQFFNVFFCFFQLQEDF